MSEKKKTFEHVIRERWCKGCNICVAFCPKNVLALKDGKVSVVHPELCIGCRLCELRCPDYAIEVHEKGKAKDPEVDANEREYGIAPEAEHD